MLYVAVAAAYIGLLIDVLTRVESASREVAEYADRLKIAGGGV